MQPSNHCQVYLHPASLTSPIAVRAIECVTGLTAQPSLCHHHVMLVTRPQRADHIRGATNMVLASAQEVTHG